jgi:hypothetical protein
MPCPSRPPGLDYSRSQCTIFWNVMSCSLILCKSHRSTFHSHHYENLKSHIFQVFLLLENVTVTPKVGHSGFPPYHQPKWVLCSMQHWVYTTSCHSGIKMAYQSSIDAPELVRCLNKKKIGGRPVCIVIYISDFRHWFGSVSWFIEPSPSATTIDCNHFNLTLNITVRNYVTTNNGNTLKVTVTTPHKIKTSLLTCDFCVWHNPSADPAVNLTSPSVAVLWTIHCWNIGFQQLKLHCVQWIIVLELLCSNGHLLLNAWECVYLFVS